MHEVRIRDEIWDDLKSAAERQQRKPETLANQALKEFLHRMADQELLDRSRAAARRARLRLPNVERAIHQFRRKM
jgi:predicted transcriptional regulator